jgi:hypothetical protein
VDPHPILVWLKELPAPIRYGIAAGSVFLYGVLEAWLLWFAYGFTPTYNIICVFLFGIMGTFAIYAALQEEGFWRSSIVAALVLGSGVLYYYLLTDVKAHMLAHGLSRGPLAQWVASP